jgi:hypothetical protein
VWLEPVEENGLPEIVLIAVEIAGVVAGRAAAAAEEAVDGVDDPVAVVAVVATVARDTKERR